MAGGHGKRHLGRARDVWFFFIYWGSTFRTQEAQHTLSLNIVFNLELFRSFRQTSFLLDLGWARLMPLLLTLEELRQEENEVNASLGYFVNYRTSWATIWDTVLMDPNQIVTTARKRSCQKGTENKVNEGDSTYSTTLIKWDYGKLKVLHVYYLCATVRVCL